jgi:hypothetical protein
MRLIRWKIHRVAGDLNVRLNVLTRIQKPRNSKALGFFYAVTKVFDLERVLIVDNPVV